MAVPVIFLSALGDATSLERGNRLGVEHYLVKPFTAKQLLAVVSGTLRRYAELRPRAGHQAGDRSARAGRGPLDFEADRHRARSTTRSGGLCRGRVYLDKAPVAARIGVFAVQFLHRCPRAR
jgi:DNA-binding response OmpR family regulator